MPESKLSPRRIAAVEKQGQALELRMAGRTWREIAEALGYASHSGAIEAVRVALQKTLEAPASEFRALTLERLTKVLQTIWPTMLRGDLAAAKVCLQTIGQMSSLMGVEMPSKVEHSGPEGTPIQHQVVTLEIDDIREALGALSDAGAIRVESNGHLDPAVDIIYPPQSNI